MNYRFFGRTGWEVSALGFGAMRLPTIGPDASVIDEAEAIRMIRYGIDHGINYVDTAYVYHGGKSEVVVGKALKDGYRERTKVATKMPTWLIKAQLDMDKYFMEQLERLQTDYVDFYLLHGLGGYQWNKLKALGVCGWLEEKVNEGVIGHVGFSFHDSLEVFEEIIDDYDGWDFCQIQLNYVDADFQAGIKGLRYAASKGLGVVVMEPIAGGRLAINPPEEIQAIWDSSSVKRTPAEWALKWVWNHPEVSVVLSGMSTLKQVKENVKSADKSKPGELTRKELALYDLVKQKYQEIGYLSCTGCRYCLPCPEGVDIPEILTLYNEYYTKDRNEEIAKKYAKLIAPENQAKKCVNCGKCEELCPQKIPIRAILSEASFLFDKDE